MSKEMNMHCQNQTVIRMRMSGRYANANSADHGLSERSPAAIVGSGASAASST